MEQIGSPADGLQVFVTDPSFDIRGLYYFDAEVINAAGTTEDGKLSAVIRDLKDIRLLRF